MRLTLTDELKFVPVEPERTEGALTTAREQRLELRAQENRQKLVALSLSSVASERLPSVSLNGDYGWIGVKPEDAMATRSIGLTFSVPIFDGGQRESRISETRSRVRQESIRMRDVSDQVTLEVRNALLTLESSTQQVAVTEKGLELALKELTFARDRFTAGLGTNIEVTNATDVRGAGAGQPNRSPVPLQCFADQSRAGQGRDREAVLTESRRWNAVMRRSPTAEWKVSGDKGAARVLGMNASTLSSRMKALGIAKPVRS